MPPLNNFTRSCLAMAIGQSTLTPVTQAATINVTSSSDDIVGCTLRRALISINRASLRAGCINDGGPFGVDDTINLNLAPESSTISLTIPDDGRPGGQLLIDVGKAITINGAIGADVTIDGGGRSRVFSLRESSLSIDSLTITGGSSSTGGGGVHASSSSTVSISNSTISGCSADAGGGVYASYSSSISLSNSTVSGNLADRGGGVYVDDSRISLNNSTVSGNFAGFYGGGIYASTLSSVNLNNTLVGGNRAGARGAEIAIIDTGTIVSAGANLFGDSDHANAEAFDNFIPSNNDITATSDGTNPTELSSILSPLADNGGPTLTHALPAGSPALNAADTATCINTDQRGEPRDLDGPFFVVKAANQKTVAFNLGGECDIGSFER